ncbi:Teneurin-m, partial [Armadillidium vulgare]
LHRIHINERIKILKIRASVVRGRIISGRGAGLVGVRVSHFRPKDTGFTLSRQGGWFDLMKGKEQKHSTVILIYNCISTKGFMIKLKMSNGDKLFNISVFVMNIFTKYKCFLLQIVVIDTVVLTTTEVVPPPPPTTCPDHNYISLKPVVLATWKHGFQGGCSECSAILTESQGFYSKKLSKPIQILSSLTLGIDLMFTGGVQRVYGVTWAIVRVGYAYSNCDQIIWDTQSTQVSGHDMSVSDIGGWDLSIHHRYNFHEAKNFNFYFPSFLGILQKGDGSNMYLKQRPRILKTVMGDGRQREVNCRSCEGPAKKQRLLTPAALAPAPDGSLYVADFNLIRRIFPDKSVKTVVRLNETRVSYRYHLTVSPVDGSVFISDPEAHQILKVKDPDDTSRPEENFIPHVGSGERCLPGDEIGCGDGGLARDAKLQYPKGMAISSEEILYFADGTNVRAVDSDGIISTVIGTHRHRSHWQPLPCSGTLSVVDVSLRWPTSLAVSPLDESLYVLDDHHILRLTTDGRVKVVAGRPLHCPPLSKNGPTDLAAQTTLRSPQSIAFTPNGDLYIAESDTERINRIRIINTDERIEDFAGAESKCNCREEMCPCFDESHVLASTAIFSTISAIAVTPDGAVHVLDQGNLRIRSVIASIPQPTESRDYEIYSPETQEVYIFNRFGHHIETRNIPTQRTLYIFIYNVNTSNGKLSSVTDAAGNKINFLRDYAGLVTMIENSRQQKSRLKMSRMRRLEEMVTPDEHNVTLTYHGASGLLRSRMDSTGRAHVYTYDKYGRLTRTVTPSGQVIDLSFDLSEKGARVTVTRDATSPVTMLIKGTTVTETIGSASSVISQLPDGSVILRNPWGHHIATETVAYTLLRNNILANSFPVHGRQRTEINEELVNSFDWKYFMEVADEDSSIVKQMGRKMRVNGEELLTFKYDLFSGTEAVINKGGNVLLNVTYDDLGRPLRWTPAEPFHSVSLKYDRYGLLQEWQWGEQKEDYIYDRAGRFEGITYADGSKITYSYKDLSSIKPYKVAVHSFPYKVAVHGGTEHLLEYDEGGALSSITTPRGHKYFFQIQPSVLHNRFSFTPPGSPRHPYQILYSDNGKLLAKVLPQQAGRVIYNYDEAGRLQHQIFGDGSVEYGYQPETGLIRSVTLRELAYEQRIDNKYHAGLVKEQRVRFGPAVPLNAAKMRFLYDGNARPRRVEIEINGKELPDYEMKYDMIRGTLENIDDMKITRSRNNKTVIQDSRKTVFRVSNYDSYGRIQEETLTIHGRLLHRLRYAYDLRGRLASKTTWRGPGSLEYQSNYSYTPDGYLQSVEGAESWQFRYDSNGNMISVVEGGREITAIYDSSDRLVDWGDDQINIYDAAGRVIQQRDVHFSYTARGNIRHAWKENHFRVTYRHDHKGRLTSWEDHLGNVTQFFYTDLRKPSLPTHIHYPSIGLTHTMYYNDRGHLTAMQTENGRLWIITDSVGTPLSVYDSTGVLVKEILRSPWGETLRDTKPEIKIHLDFFGSIRDPVTGFLIFDMHPYDPKHGQWMVPRYDRVPNTPEKVVSIYMHRFHDNNPINSFDGRDNHYTDTHNWLKLFGMDMDRMLGSKYHDETLDDPLQDLETPNIEPSLRVISGLSCSKKGVLSSFSRPSLLPESLVQIDEPRLASSTWSMLGRFSSSGPVLGPGILVSRVNERALVTLVPYRENSVVQAVARDVLNGSSLLDLTLPHHRHHTLYLLKEDVSAKDDDLEQLQRLSGLFNVTSHEGEHPEIRVIGYTTSLVFIYGTTPEAARHRLLRHVHHRAAEHAWQAEKRLLESGGPSLHPWTPEERDVLLQEGKVPGFVAAELHSVHRFPLLADDASNVVFRKDVDRRRRRSRILPQS